MPPLEKKRRRPRKQRLLNHLLKELKKPKRRITKPPSEKQKAARERMKRVSARAQQIYYNAPKGTINWLDAVRQAWKEV